MNLEPGVKRMSKEQQPLPVLIRPSDPPVSRAGLIRLVVIPSGIYIVWMIVIALFEEDHQLFRYADPQVIMLYTVFSCIITGMIIPVYCIRESFVTGAVKLFQIGFVSTRRIFFAGAMTIFFGYAVNKFILPSGTGGVSGIPSCSCYLQPLLPLRSAGCCWGLMYRFSCGKGESSYLSRQTAW